MFSFFLVIYIIVGIVVFSLGPSSLFHSLTLMPVGLTVGSRILPLVQCSPKTARTADARSSRRMGPKPSAPGAAGGVSLSPCPDHLPGLPPPPRLPRLAVLRGRCGNSRSMGLWFFTEPRADARVRQLVSTSSDDGAEATCRLDGRWLVRRIAGSENRVNVMGEGLRGITGDAIIGVLVPHNRPTNGFASGVLPS